MPHCTNLPQKVPKYVARKIIFHVTKLKSLYIYIYIVCKMKGMGYCGDFCSRNCAEDPTTPHYTAGTYIVVKTQMCYIFCML